MPKSKTKTKTETKKHSKSLGSAGATVPPRRGKHEPGGARPRHEDRRGRGFSKASRFRGCK